VEIPADYAERYAVATYASLAGLSAEEQDMLLDVVLRKRQRASFYGPVQSPAPFELMARTEAATTWLEREYAEYNFAIGGLRMLRRSGQ
jgi:hypothetical protein